MIAQRVVFSSKSLEVLLERSLHKRAMMWNCKQYMSKAIHKRMAFAVDGTAVSFIHQLFVIYYCHRY